MYILKPKVPIEERIEQLLDDTNENYYTINRLLSKIQQNILNRKESLLTISYPTLNDQLELEHLDDELKDVHQLIDDWHEISDESSTIDGFYEKVYNHMYNQSMLIYFLLRLVNHCTLFALKRLNNLSNKTINAIKEDYADFL